MAASAIAALKQVEFDHDKAEHSQHEASKQTCCSKLSWSINNKFPVQSIKAALSKFLTKSYDLLTILISVADITTDVWVIYNFQRENRETFFTIALIVMILAQLSYAVAAMIRIQPVYSNEICGSNCCGYMIQFGFMLLLSPFMSFIFFVLSESPDGYLAKCLEWFGYEDGLESNSVNSNQASILIWIKHKAIKHMGFILEAMIEALPQSIIQLIAIVYYQDTQLINIVSICISLLSVATKTMVFSVAIDFRVFIFNWLSLVCDFFGIFAIVCWVFYNPTNATEITLVGEIWVYKATIMWGIVVLCVVFPSCLAMFQDSFECSVAKCENHGCCGTFLKSLPKLIPFFLLGCFLSAFAIILCEIIFFAPFAFVFYIIAHDRYVGGFKSIIAKCAFDFILDCKSMYKPDKITNKCMIEKDRNDTNAPTPDSTVIQGRNDGDTALDTAGDTTTTTTTTTSDDDNDKSSNVIKIANGTFEIIPLMDEIDRGLLLRKEEKLFRLIYVNYCFYKMLKLETDDDLVKFLTNSLENGNNINNTNSNSNQLDNNTGDDSGNNNDNDNDNKADDNNDSGEEENKKDDSKQADGGNRNLNINKKSNSDESGWESISLAQLRLKATYRDDGSIFEEFVQPWMEFDKVEFREELHTAIATEQPFYIILMYRFLFGYAVFMLYIWFPMYLLSRLFSMFFPLIALIYFNFESVQLLQWILTITYGILLISWIIAAKNCMYFYHWTHHLLPCNPSSSWLDLAPSSGITSELRYFHLAMIQNCYNERCNDKFIEKQRRDTVIEILGKDIGGLVVSYWPVFELKIMLEKLESQINRSKVIADLPKEYNDLLDMFHSG